MKNAFTTLQRVTENEGNYIDSVRRRLHCLELPELIDLMEFFHVSPGKMPEYVFAHQVERELREGEINLTIERIDNETELVRNLDVVRLKIVHPNCDRVTLHIKKVMGPNDKSLPLTFSRPSGTVMTADRLEARVKGLPSTQIAVERTLWEECRLRDTDYILEKEKLDESELDRPRHISRAMYKRTTLSHFRVKLKRALPSMYIEDTEGMPGSSRHEEDPGFHKLYCFEWREFFGPQKSERYIRMHDEVSRTVHFNEPL